ncbi:MAG: iron-containing alcohol dehydrogenase [Candidatus Riflebacteria bacterium]|nr:iron-containing alcohol dehydrogenase [Candidatus Riflebacteria bacterium]
MKNFTFQSPTKIIFGKGSIGALKREIPLDKKVMLLYGCSSLKSSGAYDAIKKALAERPEVFEFSGITSNPEYEYLLKCIELVKANKIDYLLAAGGGSVIDAAKFVALAALYEGEPWKIIESFGACTNKAIPLATVVTLPASGSEVNRDAVISRASKKAKLPLGNPAVYPQFAILDPELTFSLSSEQTANGILDTFVHVLEQYLTYPVNAKLQDRFAESILTTLIEDGPLAMKEPDNYEARSNLMLSSSMAMNGFLRAGVPMDWATHMISHEITSLFGIPHARALAVVIEPYLSHCKEKKFQKLLQYSRRVWNIYETDENKAVDASIKMTMDFFKSLGFKTKLSDYNLTDKDVEKITKQLVSHRMVKLGEHRDITPEVVASFLLP